MDSRAAARVVLSFKRIFIEKLLGLRTQGEK